MDEAIDQEASQETEAAQYLCPASLLTFRSTGMVRRLCTHLPRIPFCASLTLRGPNKAPPDPPRWAVRRGGGVSSRPAARHRVAATACKDDPSLACAYMSCAGPGRLQTATPWECERRCEAVGTAELVINAAGSRPACVEAEQKHRRCIFNELHCRHSCLICTSAATLYQKPS